MTNFKFNIGDKVRLKKDCNIGIDFYEGDEGIVVNKLTTINQEVMIKITKSIDIFREGYTYCMISDCLELIKDINYLFYKT